MFPYIHNGALFGELMLWNCRNSVQTRLPYRSIKFNPYRPDIRPLWIQSAARLLLHPVQSEVSYALAV